MDINHNIGYPAQNNHLKYIPEQIDFPDDNLMEAVISHMPRETKKEILMNVYERYKKEFDF